MENFTQYLQLGGQVAIVILFLQYLSKRDSKWTESIKDNSKSNVLLAKTLQKLTDKIDMNISAVNKSTNSTKKNTEEVRKSNGG